MSQLFFFYLLGFKNRVPGRSECEPVAANPCGSLWEHVSRRSSLLVSPFRLLFFFLVGEMLTVADKGLVVLDRLFENKKSVT